jgi:tetratricopeptide (TPR) repeat protein
MRWRTFTLSIVLLSVAGTALKLQFDRREFKEDSQSQIAEPPSEYHEPAKDHLRVDDEARILAPFGPRLGRMADSFHDELGIDLHVVTRTDRAASIETQADEIFQQKRIGAGAPTGGLLIILNPTLGSARIEVGYTLEGGLTDLHMGRIARDQLAPYSSYGVAGMAVMDVLHYLRDHVYVAAALGNVELYENYKKSAAYTEIEKFTSGGAGARAILSAMPADADFKRKLSADERKRYEPSGDLEESVAAFLRATRDFAGDPTLELFTEGSRLMRAHYPLAPFEELKRFERIHASMPLEYVVQEDYAVATSKRPAHGFVPILLHRENGLWRIDLVETWKNLFFNNDGNYDLRNSNTPYGFGLTQFGRGGYHNIAGWSFSDSSTEQVLAALEYKRDAVSALYRAEIWFRNCFVFPQAFLAYEAAREAAPKDPLMLQLFGDRALYLGFPELAIPLLEPVGRGAELSLADAYRQIEDIPNARRWLLRALEENPYDMRALHRLQSLAEQERDREEVREVTQTLEMLNNDEQHGAEHVWLFFDPNVPNFDANTTIDVNGTKVFDHSHFGVTMQNKSNRAVEIESVTLTSVGTAAASGLGDITDYWRFPSGHHQLLANEHVYFKKDWGFTVDTGHQHVRYVFRICWHGVGTSVRQCRTQWVDTFPWTSLPGTAPQLPVSAE